MTRLSIIIPVLNEEAALRSHLPRLQPLRDAGHEVIVVDGGSDDESARIASAQADQVLVAPQGRARQMNAGAAAASGGILVFLHIDTLLPDATLQLDEQMKQSSRVWGRFDLRLSGEHPAFRLLERLISLRSRVSGIVTGDQTIFVRSDAFALAGGYPDMPLMEDVVLSRRLLRQSRPLCLRDRVVSSSRRWERDGILRTVLLMWFLRLRFYLGADPGRLAEIYQKKRP